MGYAEIYDRALRDPESFWGEAARAIHWDAPWEKVLDDSGAPFYRWFPGGRLNTCYNALDRHVDNGRGDQPAVIHDSPVTGIQRSISYREMRDEVALFAGALARLGVGKGDRVIIYMPMVPEALISMLACARIGAVHSVVFGGFSAHELAARIDDARPRVVVAGSCGIEPSRVVPYKPMLDRAIEQAAYKPEHCIILQRPEGPGEMVSGRDLEWHEALQGAEPQECVSVAATDPLYILYTSGTTGRPKGVVRDNGGHAVALKWSMEHVYGVKPGEVYWAASDVGWGGGPLLHRLWPTAARLHHDRLRGQAGGYARPGRVLAGDRRAPGLGHVHGAHRVSGDQEGRSQGEYLARHDLTVFRALFLAGERCDPDTLNWAAAMLDRPVIDHWWQTETGWAIAGNFLGIERLPVKPGSAGRPVPGYDVRILGDQGEEVPAGTMGRIMLRLPMPPGCLLTLWNNDRRFREAYLDHVPGYYLTGDSGYLDEDGDLYVMGRIDDTINVAGHRLSSGAMEEILAAHPAVAECAVIAVADDLKGSLPLGLVVVKSGVTQEPDALCRELVAKVREEIGPVAAFRKVVVVDRLPKTRSGKILRGVMRRIADNEAYQTPATIDDPAILEEIRNRLRSIGYATASFGDEA
jgi:propionyl-CoA synthetase